MTDALFVAKTRPSGLRRAGCRKPILASMLALLPGCGYPQDAGIDSVLWLQSSVEYHVTALQSFEVAKKMLEEGLRDSQWTASLEQKEQFESWRAQGKDLPRLEPAVVVDVDETVLDNSAYQGRLIREHLDYSGRSWSRWCRDVQATPVPGARGFVKYAAERHVTVFYVTNRTHEVEEATRQNLSALGFHLDDDMDTLLTLGERDGWGSKKGSRRQAIADMGYRIILLVGDNLGDFVDGYKTTPQQRQRLMEDHREMWGARWIVVPNPMYGSWQRALYEYQDKLPARKKLRRKLEAVRTWVPADGGSE